MVEGRLVAATLAGESFGLGGIENTLPQTNMETHIAPV